MKTRNCISLVIVALMGVLQLGVLPAARADMTTTTETRMFLNPAQVEIGSRVHYARDHNERIETYSKLGGFPVDETTISLCEENRQITLDKKLNIYYERSFMWPDKYIADEKAKSDAIKAQKFPADKTGTVVENFQITAIGEAVIAGVNSKGYLLKSHTEKTGCAKMVNDDKTDYRTEYWFGEKDKVLTCFEAKFPDAFNGKILEKKRFEIVDGCKISYETKDDSNVIGENFGKLLMRTTMSDGDKLFYSEEIVKISEDKLSDALFAVPADAKKVDKAQYDSARKQALRQGIAALRDAKTKAAAEAAKN